MMIEIEPSLIGCYIGSVNHSFQVVQKSKECVFNIPTVELAPKVVEIGTYSGREVNKFEKFELTPLSGKKVKAPLIRKCATNFECKLIDSKMIKKYSLFVFEVVKAPVAPSPKFPKTIHYRGDGLFMISGPTIRKYRKLFKPENL